MDNSAKNSNLEKVLKVVLFLLLAGMLITGSMLIRYAIGYKNDRTQNEAIKTIAYKAASSSGAASISTVEISGDDKAFNPIDFAALKEINPDIVGWISACDGEIDGPIVQGTDNSFYLDHRFDKSEGSVGTFFADSSFTPAFDNLLTVVYGHNRKDGSMFHPLLQYKSEDYYKEHQEFVVYTEKEVITYHVFSAYFADNDEAFGGDYEEAALNGITMEKIKEMYKKAMEKSLYYIMYIPDTSDIIILSTCEYSGSNNRMVVYGVRER